MDVEVVGRVHWQVEDMHKQVAGLHEVASDKMTHALEVLRATDTSKATSGTVKKQIAVLTKLAKQGESLKNEKAVIEWAMKIASALENNGKALEKLGVKDAAGVEITSAAAIRAKAIVRRTQVSSVYKDAQKVLKQYAQDTKSSKKHAKRLNEALGKLSLHLGAYHRGSGGFRELLDASDRVREASKALYMDAESSQRMTDAFKYARDTIERRAKKIHDRRERFPDALLMEKILGDAQKKLEEMERRAGKKDPTKRLADSVEADINALLFQTMNDVADVGKIHKAREAYRGFLFGTRAAVAKVLSTLTMKIQHGNMACARQNKPAGPDLRAKYEEHAKTYQMLVATDQACAASYSDSFSTAGWEKLSAKEIVRRSQLLLNAMENNQNALTAVAAQIGLKL